MESFKKFESPEIKKPEIENYKEIKPETDISNDEVKSFWNKLFEKMETNENEQKDTEKEQISKHESVQDIKDTLEKSQEIKTGRQYCDDNGEIYREKNSLLPNKKIEKNGYIFKTDDKGRVISAEGKLQLKDNEDRESFSVTRDTVAQGKMAVTDDRGHLIGDRFNGSSGLENLVPMDGKLNKGDYKKLENTLADAVKDGADVRLKVEPIYNGDSNRPTEFRVSYSIDGDKEVVVFKNGSEN